MRKLGQLAVSRPLLFGVALIVVWSLLTAAAYPLYYLFPDGEVGQLLGEAASKAVISVGFVGLLWRLGWLETSGMSRLGDRWSWLLTSVLGIYLISVELYAFTGDASPVVATSPLGIAYLVATLPGALMEELLFRGLVLTAMLLAWGHTRQGVAGSVVLSSLLFGTTHLINLLVRPAGVVIFQAIVVSLPGILYGALVLRTRSLWPAIVVHWLTNAAVNVRIAEMASFEETNMMWLWFALLLIPTAAFSAYLLRSHRHLDTLPSRAIAQLHTRRNESDGTSLVRLWCWRRRSRTVPADGDSMGPSPTRDRRDQMWRTRFVVCH
jgi:membrane protease YdiL (CAAX protease family)